MCHTRMMLQIRIAGIDSSVEKTTIFVANCGSTSYLAASMLVVEPAGMAVSRMLTPFTVGSTGRKCRTSITRAGMMISLCRV